MEVVGYALIGVAVAEELVQVGGDQEMGRQAAQGTPRPLRRLFPSCAEAGVPHGAEVLAKLVVQRLKLDYVGAIWQGSAVLD